MVDQTRRTIEERCIRYRQEPACKHDLIDTSIGCDLVSGEECLVSHGFLGELGVCSVGVLDECTGLIAQEPNVTHSSDVDDDADDNNSSDNGTVNGTTGAYACPSVHGSAGKLEHGDCGVEAHNKIERTGWNTSKWVRYDDMEQAAGATTTSIACTDDKTSRQWQNPSIAQGNTPPAQPKTKAHAPLVAFHSDAQGCPSPLQQIPPPRVRPTA